MSKTIILARPHPFIVSEMKPMLEQAGYTVIKLDDINDLPDLLESADGAVISLAVTSSIPESAEEVLARIHSQSPEIPVLFAGLLEFGKACGILDNMANNMGINAAAFSTETATRSPSALGHPNTLLYVSKDEISDPDRKRMARDLIRKHLG